MTAKVFEPLNVSPYSVNTVISRVYDTRRENQSNGLTSYQAARREAIVGLLSVIGGGAYLMFDFLYGGPVRQFLYPQNTNRGKAITSLTSQITESESSTFSSSSATSSAPTYNLEGRLFLDKGNSKFGTAGNGIQDDGEPAVDNTKVVVVDDSWSWRNGPPGTTDIIATATSDSSGDFKFDLPEKRYIYIPLSDKFSYMCEGADQFCKINEGYFVNVGGGTSKISAGLMKGFLSYPKWDVRGDLGGYYDRDSREGYILWWNGEGGHVNSHISDLGEDDTTGTHFAATPGEVIPAFAPGTVTGVYPETPENWFVISTDLVPSFNVSYAHSSEVLVKKGQKVSRYDPIAKAGTRGVEIDTGGAAIVHLQLDQLGLDHIVRLLDPYKPIYPINPSTYGCWSVPQSSPEGNPSVSWLPLPIDNWENYLDNWENHYNNWENYWIVEDQTHY